MTDDDDTLRSDEELSAELAAINASRRDDGPAELRVLAGRPDLLALARAHHHQVDARRAVVVHLLSVAGLPRRLAALDAWLEVERAALAGEREHLAGLPFPVLDNDLLAYVEMRITRMKAHQVIASRLCSIGTRARQRAGLAARLKAGCKRSASQEASARLYFGPWRGFTSFD